MDRRRFIGTVASGLLAAPLAAEAQQAAKIARIGFLGNEAEVAARALGMRLQFVEARGTADFDRAFSDMTTARAGGLTVLPSSMFNTERRRLADLAAKSRLPAVYQLREYVDAGALWPMELTSLI